MSFWINRRRFMQAASSAMTMGALPSFGSSASAQSSGELRIRVSGGAYGKAIIDAYVKPFEAETGIKVRPITDWTTLAQIELMQRTNSVSVDVGLLDQATALVADGKGYLEKVDYSIYRQAELDGIVDYCRQPFGIAAVIYSFNMVYNTEKFPTDKPRPTSWAEFWDVKKFPGIRTLVSGQTGSQGPWEEALLADGVAVNALYPMNIDRVFASLDKIKPHIRKWWTTGSEVQQIMREKAADLQQSYDGRAIQLIDESAPLEIDRNQAKLTWDYWIILKGSPNARNAQRFVEFATRADRQAAFAQLFPIGPTNRNAFMQLPEKAARKLATHPDYMASSYPMNAKWYAEIGPDGVSNTQRLIKRWNEWILS